MGPRFTVITSFRNNQHCLDRLLKAFEDYAPDSTRVIVVDSASATPPRIPSSSRLQIESIYNPKGTLTSSINVGIGLVEPSCPWIWIFDADAYPLDSALFELPEYADTLDRPGIVAPCSVDSEGRSTACYEDREVIILRYLLGPVGVAKFQQFFTKKKQSHVSTEVARTTRTIFSQCILIPAPLLRSIGGFDEDFVAWGCDNDLSKRLRKMGKSLYIAPAYRLEHEGGSSLSGSNYTRVLLEHRAFSLLAQKHYPLLHKLLRPAVFLRHLIEVAVGTRRSPEYQEARWHLLRTCLYDYK